MRTRHILALAAAASFTTLAQAAPQAPDAPGSTIQVPGVPMAPYRLKSDDYSYYKGTYELSNGKYLVVSNRGKRFFAEIDGERRAELIPVGRNVFVARDADMIMMFDEVYNGQLNDVVIRPRRQVG
jgi:hypothetical protein